MTLKQIVPFVLVVAWSQAGAFQPVPHFQERRMGFAAHGEYFNTDANLIEDGGQYDSLGLERRFETLSLRLSADFLVKQSWRLTGGGEVVYAKSTDPIIDRTATELNHLFLESLHILKYGSWILAPQIRAVGSLKEIDRTTDEVITGEGTHQFEFGGWAAWNAGPFEPYAYIGYRFQNDGRANLLPFQAGVRYHYDDLYLLGEVYGHFPVSSDEYADQKALRMGVTNAVNAGSFRFYAIDQTLIEGRGELGYHMTPDFTLYGGGGHTIDGKNAAYGYTISFGILYTYGAEQRPRHGFLEDGGEADFSDEKPRPRRKRQAPRKKKKSEEFRPVIDDYDESLFTPAN